MAESLEPITTMGGLRLLPDMLVADLHPAASTLLVLPGADLWDAGGGEAFADAAARFLVDGVPVAAICGATALPYCPRVREHRPVDNVSPRKPGTHSR